MTLPSDAEILATLERLSGAVADDLESPHLEFKPWINAKEDMRVAVEYAVCFANAEGGVMVFGVADKTRGRAAAIHGAKGYDLDVWRRGIFDATRPHLAVEVNELAVPEGTGRLLLVRVPAGDNPPYGTAQGVFKQRIGKNCMPLDPASFQRGRIASGSDERRDAKDSVQRKRAGAVEPHVARHVARYRWRHRWRHLARHLARHLVRQRTHWVTHPLVVHTTGCASETSDVVPSKTAS